MSSSNFDVFLHYLLKYYFPLNFDKNWRFERIIFDSRFLLCKFLQKVSLQSDGKNSFEIYLRWQVEQILLKDFQAGLMIVLNCVSFWIRTIAKVHQWAAFSVSSAKVSVSGWNASARMCLCESERVSYCTSGQQLCLARCCLIIQATWKKLDIKSIYKLIIL